MAARDLTGSHQPGKLGTIGNPLDYAPPPVGASTTTTAATVDTTLDGAMTAASPAAGGSFDVTSATGFPTPPSTTLASDTDELNAVTLTLTDASSFSSSGEVRVGTERIAYGSKTGNVLGDLVRGVGGTTPAAHTAGATVTEPRVVVVEAERIVYHAIASNTIDDVRRDNPTDHADLAPVAPNGLALALTSVAGFPTTGGTLTIGDERMAYSSVSGSSLQSVERAADGTEVEAHTSGAAVDLDAYVIRGASLGSRRGSVPLFLPNRSGGTLTRGSMVKLATGGGFEAATEGDAILGVLGATTVDDGWGPVLAGGYASFLVDAADPAAPNPGEPVFARSATSVKSLANADTDDQAVGYCLRTHDVDYDGVTALALVRVDLVLVSSLGAPYTAA